jgi:hypothetical protein
MTGSPRTGAPAGPEVAGLAPAGRSFAEYCTMFGLSREVGSGAVLGVGDGLSNFNAEATRLGWRVTSVDPLYGLEPEILERCYRAVLERAVARMARSPRSWVWHHYASPYLLRTHRQLTTRDFLADFRAGREAGRYVNAALPRLPFADRSFDVAVCSHVLFTWSSVLDLDFHVQAITEMLRVATEVRLFPATGAQHERVSGHLDAVVEYCRGRGYFVGFEDIGIAERYIERQRLVIRSGAIGSASARP